MNMYSIGDASIMVVIVACFMMVGALSYYFNSRIINLERTIVKQNHVLTDFISNVKNNTMVSHGEEIEPVPPSQELCKPSKFSEKIGVSDSEYSHTCDSESASDFEDNSTRIMNAVIQLSPCQQECRGPIIVELVDAVPKCTVKLGDLETVEQLDNLSASSGPVSNENESCTITSTGTSIDFKKMKLTQLKDIASSKGIDVKGKKKNDLVETLNKQ